MARFAWTIAAVVVAAIVLLGYGMNRYAQFDMAHADEGDIAQRYRLVCGAYGEVRIDPNRVPVDLAPLIDYAKQFGHANSIIRKDCASKLSLDEAQKFVVAFDAKKPQIEARLAQFPIDFPADEVRASRELLLFRYEIAPAATQNDRAV
jgi:hypothetical protein